MWCNVMVRPLLCLTVQQTSSELEEVHGERNLSLSLRKILNVRLRGIVELSDSNEYDDHNHDCGLDDRQSTIDTDGGADD